MRALGLFFLKHLRPIPNATMKMALETENSKSVFEMTWAGGVVFVVVVVVVVNFFKGLLFN